MYRSCKFTLHQTVERIAVESRIIHMFINVKAQPYLLIWGMIAAHYTDQIFTFFFPFLLAYVKLNF